MSANRRDKRRERYSRNTQGWNAQGIFSPDPELAIVAGSITDLTYTGVAGEIGIYDQDGVALAAKPADGTKIVIAQKNSDGNLKRTTEIVQGQYTAIRTAFDAPVIQQDDVSPLNIVIVGGLQEFVLSVRNTTPANQPFPVQEGRAIVRSGNPSEVDIATKIVEDINNSGDYERDADNAFVKVNVTSDAVQSAALNTGAMTLTDGSAQAFIAGVDDTLVFVAGGYLLLVTGEVYPIVSSSYDGTNTTVFLGRAASINQLGVLTVAIGGASAEVVATIDAAVTGIRIQGQDELTHFTTSVSEDLGDAVITHTTDWNFGSGAAWQVASIEDECAVFDGWTTVNEAWVRDFGAPDLWIDDSDDTAEYALIIIESLNRIIPSAGTPQNQTLMQANIILAAPNAGALDVLATAIFVAP